MKNFLLVLLFFTTIGVASAQMITIKGRVMSAEDNLPVIGATVRLNVADSTKTGLPGRAVATDVNGYFTITSREKQNDITITYLGFKDFFVQIEQGKREVNLQTIVLEPTAIGIDAAVITARGTMATLKGDTVQYNASNFKTNPDATAEDLVKKMPGVTTESDGSVSSQGQKITKVLVDGKEFFDNDPSLALKSLPSDAVESVQFLDDKTDNARFSGFDDGERVRTVNIVTKAGVKQSTFGRAFAGYGTDQRYGAGVGMSTFNGNHRWTIAAQTNNVNNQGFSLSDISGGGFGGGGGRGMMRVEGVNSNAFQTSAFGGIRKANMMALNYNGTINDKLKLSFNYSIGNIAAEQSSNRTDDNLVTSRYTNTDSRANSLDNRHNLFMRTEWTPSKNNKITFNPRISYGLNRGNSNNESTIDSVGIRLNDEINRYNTKYETFNGAADLWWQHAFTKPGRVLSLGGQLSGNKGIGYREQYSEFGSLQTITPIQMALDTIDRRGNLTTSGYSMTGSATYTEPLSKSSRISVNYNISYNRTLADQVSKDFDKLVQDYVLYDTTGTNYINRNYTTHTTGLSYGYVQGKKLTMNVGVDYMFANQNSAQDRLVNNPTNDPAKPQAHMTTDHSFRALQPSFNMRFNPKQGQSLNVDLRLYSGFPSLSQLQDVIDYTTPTRVVKGNPNLDQSYNTRLRLQYNVANTTKNINFNIMAIGTKVDNYITNNVYFLQKDTVVNGITLNKRTQYTTYENVDGYLNGMVFANFGFGIKQIKSNMNISANYRYSKQPSMQDGVKYISNNNSVGMRMSLTSNISENVDFTFSYDPSLTMSTAGTGRFDRYLSHNFGGFLNLYLTKNLFINADASWRNSYGTQVNSSQHYTMLNAAIGYKFLKKKQAELKLQGYDLLDQNKSYWLSQNNTSVQTSTNYSILKRYFMFTFTYKFDTRKNSKNFGSGDGTGGYRPGEGRPPGGGPGGRMMHP